MQRWLSADFLTETLQARKEWHDIFKVMIGKNLALVKAATRVGWEEVLPSCGCFLKLRNVSLSVFGKEISWAGI